MNKNHTVDIDGKEIVNAKWAFNIAGSYGGGQNKSLIMDTTFDEKGFPKTTFMVHDQVTDKKLVAVNLFDAIRAYNACGTDDNWDKLLEPQGNPADKKQPDVFPEGLQLSPEQYKAFPDNHRLIAPDELIQAGDVCAVFMEGQWQLQFYVNMIHWGKKKKDFPMFVARKLVVKETA